MGLITSIRKRLWVVTILMALALLGFIVMDMSSGRSSWFFNNPDSVGKIAGESISWKDFQKTESVLYKNADVDIYGRKEYLWNQFLEKGVLKEEAKHIGFGVSESELTELEFGNNLSPIIERNFRDPNTGQILREQLNQFKDGYDALPQEAKDFWQVQQKEIIKERQFKKLENIIKNSLYMPDFMLARQHEESNTKITLISSMISYDQVNEKEVTITDEDVQKFVSKNPNKYKSEFDTRNIKYSIIDIFPTQEDSSNIRKILEDKVEAFKLATKDSIYVVSNLGKWDEAYKTKSEIKGVLNDSSFSIFDLNVGDVYGPYVEEGEYRLAKVLGKKVIPDSVKSRHILRQVKSREEYIAASKLLDSLKTLIETGKGKFDSLAMQFSQDGGSSIKGGDMGYYPKGAMVQQFNDITFYKGEKGKLYIIATQFGLHLVQITDQKFIKNEMGVHLGIISETIAPGDDITDSKLEEAQKLIEENNNLVNLEKVINEGGKYKLETAANILENGYQIKNFGENSSSAARDIIKWAFNKETKPGDVSLEVYSLQDPIKKFTNRYIIAGLSSINEKGIPKGEALLDLVREDVMKDVKFNKIVAAIGTVNDLTTQYGSYTAVIDTTKETTTNSGQLKTGYEYDLISQVAISEPNTFVGPIRGESGVYFAKLLEKKDPGKQNNVAMFRQFYKHPAVNTAMTYLMAALKKNYGVVDHRSKFF
ncbi:MAG: peptidylprolyl isomerase [Saprospiraceae bacterium]